MRHVLGVLAKDVPRYVMALAGGNSQYLGLHNRMERLEAAPDGSGYRCAWQWTSNLHAPKVVPFLGRWLMKRAFDDHPIRRLGAPEVVSEPIDISVIIGHRGMSRLPQLLATLESVAGQRNCSVECIVVEQDVDSRLSGRLPSWVRHVHVPPPVRNMPYCRSWAFNLGAGMARGGVLVLHDNDMLMPVDYASEILFRMSNGYDVVNLKRYIFYLSQAHTGAVMDGAADMLGAAPETIMQNAEAGGSIAIAREAFWRIGGMDESFVGWGGEDNEFWERAQTLRVWPWGYLPLVHLWHASQPGKHGSQNPNAARYRAMSKVEPVERIRTLCLVPRGQMTGPTNWPSAGERPCSMPHHDGRDA